MDLVSVSAALGQAVLGQAVPGQAVPGAASAPSLVETVLGMVLKGGWIMVPLGLCSLAAVTIIVERWIVTRRARVCPAGLESEIPAMRKTPRQALIRLRGDQSPLARVLSAAFGARGMTRDAVEKRVAEAGEREIVKLRERMRILSALPQAATMLGLLGTVFGMIRTFTVVAASGESLGKTEKLAQGIYEAWTATAAGLAIAIPTLLMYHFILSRIDGAAALLDRAAVKALEEDAEAGDVVVPREVMKREEEPVLAIAEG